MLYLDNPIGPIKGLMIYRDHQNRNLFYFASERPRLALNDGVPEFVYLKYRRDITDNPDFDPATKEALGGGFMAFTVDLGVSDEALDEVKRELRTFADGPVQLSPVQFRKGSVRLSITKDAADAEDAPPEAPRGLTFFEEVYGASKPSLIGYNRATFSVVLSQEAATLFEAALRAGISPIGVIYDLKFLGLAPAFDVKITAEYHRIYTHLETEFGARGQIQVVSLAVDIAAAFQKLRDEGAIKVEVLNFSDDEDLRNQAKEAFDWFKTELLKDFFQSALEPPSFMTRSGSNGLGLLGQLQSLFGALNTPQATASPVPARGNPTTAEPTPAAAPQTQDDGVRATSETNRAVAATGGGGGGGQASGADASVAPFQVAFSLKFYRQEELKTRVFEYSMQQAVEREAAPQGLFSTMVEGLDLSRAIQEINLDDEFFKRLVATVSMGGDLEAAGISTVAVNLEYPAERRPGEEPLHVDGFTFRPDDLEPKIFTTWLNAKKALSYRYQMRIHFKPETPWVGKEAEVTTDWVVTRDRQLTLDPLSAVGLFDLPLSFGDIDSGEVTQAQVELLYEDEANDFSARQTFLLKPDDEPRHWRLRLSNPEHRSYQYRILYFLPENARHQTDWITSDDASLVINEPYESTLNVRLVPVLDANTLVEAIVNLTYEEPGYKRNVQTVFTPSEIQSREIAIPTLAADPAAYTYAVTVVRTDGSVFESGPKEAQSRAVIISDGEGAAHRIQVKLLTPNLAQGGFAALKVDLQGAGDHPDSDSVLFTPSQETDKILTLVQPQPNGSNTFTYSYKVTGYTQQGVPVDGERGETSTSTLLVRAPSP